MAEYVGLDVSKEETSICVKDTKGKLLACGKALSDPDSLFEWLREHCICPELIVMETGTMSGWLTRGLRAKGLRVECIDAVRAHAVMKLKRNKTDANDADLLAELARTGFFEAVTVKSLPAHHVQQTGGRAPLTQGPYATNWHGLRPHLVSASVPQPSA